MEDAQVGLVRYRGRLMSKAKAKLLKQTQIIHKAHKYAPKGSGPLPLTPQRPEKKRMWELAMKLLEERFLGGLDAQKDI